MIKLCYKEYEYKLSLAATKYFREKTGKNLPYTLMKYLDSCRDTVGMDEVKRLSVFLGVEDEHVAAQLFYAVIKQVDSSIPLAELEDAMFRTSWLPSNQDCPDMCQPWPYVMIQLATQVSEYYSELDKKKVSTSELVTQE